MPDASPLRILVLAPPDAPGAEPLLARARAARDAGRPLEILLSGRGLAWTHSAALARLAQGQGVGVGLCSRSAREHGVDPASIPPWIRWTSLVAFFTHLEPDAELLGLLP